MSTRTSSSEPASGLPDMSEHLAMLAQAVSDMTVSSFDSVENLEMPPNGDDGTSALESHEVIELQSFIERKAWVDEKIHFLEQLPTIEVFVGVEALSSSALEIPGLPSRKEYNSWLEEHDRIEREIESADSTELKRLREFTKATSKKNLSPEDTDLIELTLTTIKQVDKLLHLLRDRSERLDLLGTRLTWEEARISAWTEHNQLLQDAAAFLNTRARWSQSIYDTIPVMEPTPSPHTLVRRGSTASLASLASIDSVSSLPGLSRGMRFKLAEVLSRDAAVFAGRISSLHHVKVSGAGKALDKLIDDSRKPIPDELLDEQDKLEEKAITDLEDFGRFIMDVVTQWRKADEIYAETMHDQHAAQRVLDEIEEASYHHPILRQAVTFSNRAEALVKRLRLRGDPARPGSAFPQPQHHLFPDQQEITEALIQKLSTDISSTTVLAKRASSRAQEYRKTAEGIRHVEGLCKTCVDLQRQLQEINTQLLQGFPSIDADGSPPDLSTEECLSPTKHGAFLDRFSTLSTELQRANTDAQALVRDSRIGFLVLDHPSVDADFKLESLRTMGDLETLNAGVHETHSQMVSKIARLQSARQMWHTLLVNDEQLGSLQQEIIFSLEKERWTQKTHTTTLPLTPESPRSIIAPDTAIVTPGDAAQRLQGINARISAGVTESLFTSFGEPLRYLFDQRLTALRNLAHTIEYMLRLLTEVRTQTAVMQTVQGDALELEVRVEDMKLRLDSFSEALLSGQGSAKTKTGEEDEKNMNAEIASVQATVQRFMSTLHIRVPFLVEPKSSPLIITFDIQGVNAAVRTDCNALSISLAGSLEGLDQKAAYLRLAHQAASVDVTIAGVAQCLTDAKQGYASLRAQLSSLGDHDRLGTLQSMASYLTRLFRDTDVIVPPLLSSARQGVIGMDVSSGPTEHDHVIHGRRRALSEAERNYDSFKTLVVALETDLLDAVHTEKNRLELVEISEEIDQVLEELAARVRYAEQSLTSFSQLFSDTCDHHASSSTLQKLKADLDASSVQLSQDIDSVQATCIRHLQRLSNASAASGSSSHETFVLRRTRFSESVDAKIAGWRNGVDDLQSRLRAAALVTADFEAMMLLVDQFDMLWRSTDEKRTDLLERESTILADITSSPGALSRAEYLQNLLSDSIALQAEVEDSIASLDPMSKLLSDVSAFSTAQEAIVIEEVVTPRKHQHTNLLASISALSGDIKSMIASLEIAHRQESERVAIEGCAKMIDSALEDAFSVHASAFDSLQDLEMQLSSLRDRDIDFVTLEKLELEAEDLSKSQARHTEVLCPIDDLLSKLQHLPGIYADAANETTLTSRTELFDEARSQFNKWDISLSTFKSSLKYVRATELRRQEELRAKAEEERLKALRMEEEARLAVEEAERARLELERLENERLEQERLERERSERERLEQEWLEKKLLEEERLEQERLERERLERERSEQEWLEKDRLNEERLELERLEEEQLERVRLEEERLKREKLERERLEQECLQSEKAEQERLERGRLEKLEAQRKREKEEVERWRRKEEKSTEQEEKPKERLQPAWAGNIGYARESVEVEGLQKAAGRNSTAGDRTLKMQDSNKARQRGKSIVDWKVADISKRNIRNTDVNSDVFVQDADNSMAFQSNRHRPTKPLPRSSMIAPVASSLQAPFEIPPITASEVDDELRSLKKKILDLRKRLQSLNSHERLRPISPLPTRDYKDRLQAELTQVKTDMQDLPESVDDASCNVELQSLRAEVSRMDDLVVRLGQLVALVDSIHVCDESLSNLLDEIDAHPSNSEDLRVVVESDSGHSPDQTLLDQKDRTSIAIQAMADKFSIVQDDPRAVVERDRIMQTWTELSEMTDDCIYGRKSLPSSDSIGALSSGRQSRASAISSQSSSSRTQRKYGGLGAASGPRKPSVRGGHLAPTMLSTQRSASSKSSSQQPSRSSSRISMTSNRSVSNPSSTLYGSTFASRQRSISQLSDASVKPSVTPTQSRPRAYSRPFRPSSPTGSVASSASRSFMTGSRNSISHSRPSGNWSRAPRTSLSFTTPRASTPSNSKRPAAPAKKKAYIANPKNKLDVAVGDVVNRLPVNINVQHVADTWKDQSGKYWIGDHQDPKLCFCRILRSQTVMVRVGGGWMELSKFIQTHYADLFRFAPESPPASLGGREEKWISSASLLENTSPQATVSGTPPMPPRTPEPKTNFVPTFALQTPGGRSPRSMKTSSPQSGGSPLTALQFMRRAGDDGYGHHHPLRPSTPTKAPAGLPSRFNVPKTLSRPSVWRP